jgi:hypothetical protein
MPETRGRTLEDIDASFRRHKAPISVESAVFEHGRMENPDSESNVEAIMFTTSSKV